MKDQNKTKAQLIAELNETRQRIAALEAAETQRAISAEALGESERRYRLLAENVTDVIWTMDMNLRSTYTSPSVRRLRGYDSKDAMVQPLEEALTPASLEIASKALEEELALEKLPEKDIFRSRVLELEVLRKDGSTVWVETIMTFLRDPDGNPVEILGVTRDITGRKLAEQALRESEENYRLLFEKMMNGFALHEIVLNDEGKPVDYVFIEINHAFEQLTGLKREDVIGNKATEVLPGIENDPADWIGKYGEVALTGKETRFEQPAQSLDKWYSVLAYSPQKGQFATIFEEITSRKQFERVLREKEERLRLFIEHAPAALAMFDTEMYYLAVSRRWKTEFHLGDENILGRSHYEVFPEILDNLKSIHRRGLAGEVVHAEKDAFVRLDGSIQWLRWELHPWYAVDGSIGGIVIFSEDITGQVQTENALNRSVGELSALYQTTLDIISSHDLPDLLDTIVARAVDLLDGTSGGMYLCDSEKGQARCVVSYKTPQDFTGTVLAYGEGAAGIVAATGEPLIIDDYRTWEGRAKAFEENLPFSAVISVPMFWQGQVVGVIHVLHNAEERRFDGEDLKLLTSFANQAAIAVENARLLDETQRRLERLSSLRHIDQVINSSLDLRVTLNVLLGHIVQQLEVDAATVLLYQPEVQSLEFVAGRGFHTPALQFTNLRLGQGFAGQAALEQRIVRISNLSQIETGFLRSPGFHNEGFVAYIGIPLIAKGNITGVLEIYHRQPLYPDREWMAFLETLAGQAAIAIDNIRLFEDLQSTNLQLRQAYDATIEGWAQALESRDTATEGHSRRVVDLTLELAQKLGVEEKQMTHLRWGALLHDLGKMGVPDSILQKPDPLTEEEWEVIRQHPVRAYNWLAPILYLQPALDIPYYHHEKWDGTGYPRGLRGEHIPLAARIFAVVDVWDALISDRPYRKAWSTGKALEYLREQSGKHFDPQVVNAFIELVTGKRQFLRP